MTEDLLQYIWQYSLYQVPGLSDTGGNDITVIHPGKRNTNEGPDFIGARIKISGIELIGNIEIHVNESDWFRHQHQHHSAYRNIILHVVYNKDTTLDTGRFSTLDISSYILPSVIEKYRSLIGQTDRIACRHFIHSVPHITFKSWMSRLIVERWEMKMRDWQEDIRLYKNDWRSLLYLKLCENFGFKINADAFRQLAFSTPLQVLEKLDDSSQTEAVLFGQAGLIPVKGTEGYTHTLGKEYHFLAHKFRLEPACPPWKFLRMRPVNFPTIRIAQLAQVLTHSSEKFAGLLEASGIQELYDLLHVKASPFWDTHYHFNTPSSKAIAKWTGRTSIENIAINTIAPFQFFFGKHTNNPVILEKGLKLIESISPEKNHIIRQWEYLNIHATNASESQALIHLFNHYCSYKKCLDCSIGNKILNNK